MKSIFDFCKCLRFCIGMETVFAMRVVSILVFVVLYNNRCTWKVSQYSPIVSATVWCGATYFFQNRVKVKNERGSSWFYILIKCKKHEHKSAVLLQHFPTFQ